MRNEQEVHDYEKSIIAGLMENIVYLNEDSISDEGNMFFNQDKWRKLCDIGFARLNVSKEFGGVELDAVGTVSVLREFGKYCDDSGLGFAICTHLCSTCIAVDKFASEAFKEQYLSRLADGVVIGAHAISESSGGSKAFDMKTEARKVEGGWLISGEKYFVSNAPIADLVVVYAKTASGKGALGGTSAFVVDINSEGLSVGENVPKMGLKTSQMSTLTLVDVFVPEESLLGREGMAFAVLDYVMKWEILCVFAIQTGEMLSRVKRCMKHVKKKDADGNRLADFQSLTHRLVNMYIEVESAVMWLDRAAESFTQDRDATLHVSIAKLLVSEANLQTSMDAMRLHGGAGYIVETGLERSLRDSMGSVLYSGTSDIHRNRIASVLGL